jgi:hypothetical protein
VTEKCGGLATGRGCMWVAAGKVGEDVFTEDRYGVSDLFGSRFTSESRFSPELEHGVALTVSWSS